MKQAIKVRVYAGVWDGESGELIEAQQGNTFHRVKMDSNGVILAVKPGEYEVIDSSM
jgi:Ni,Fe-hydrogenase III large subunit